MEGGVRKRGSSWYYYFEAGKIDGKRKKIERKGGSTKKEALEALRKALNEFNNCGSIVSESNMSFSDYMDYWFNEYVTINCKYNTQQCYDILIKKHIKPHLGIYKIKQLNYTILQQFLNSKFKNGYSKSTLNRLKSILSTSLKMAVSNYDLIKVNPAQNLKIPSYGNKNKEQVKTLTLKQYNTILKRFPFGNNFHMALQIAFNTGMRCSEVCGLTWDRVDLENKKITVDRILIWKQKAGYVFETPKTKTSYRTISIGDTLVNMLKKNKEWQNKNRQEYGQYYTENNFVCTKENGTAVTPTTIRYLSRIVNLDLGIEFSFHSLRHTHATLLLENGSNIKEIQQRLGHSKISTTLDTYSHVTKKMIDNTVNILEDINSKLI